MNADKSQFNSFRISSASIGVYLRLILLFLFGAGARADSHEFLFDASGVDPRPKSIHLAGDFNGWSKVATPMSDSGSGVYKATVDLGEGVHYYKFVLDGEKWVGDPKFSDKELEV